MMRVSLALALALGALHPATGLAATKYPEQKAKLEQQMKAQYTLTTVTRDGAFGTPGTVLVLRKPDLNAAPSNAAVYYTNTLKGGRLTHPAIANMFLKQDVVKTFNSGEQFFVMNCEAKDDAVVVLLYSYNTYDGLLYKADVQFPFPKGYLADVTFSQVQDVIGEVFSVTPPAAAPAPPPSEQIVQQPAQPAQPVEPPQPAAPVTINLGDQTDRVVASMGQPDRIAKVANKEIYFYKDMKITFVDGKVSDIQ